MLNEKYVFVPVFKCEIQNNESPYKHNSVINTTIIVKMHFWSSYLITSQQSSKNQGSENFYLLKINYTY